MHPNVHRSYSSDEREPAFHGGVCDLARDGGAAAAAIRIRGLHFEVLDDDGSILLQHRLEGQWRRTNYGTQWQQLLLRPGVNYTLNKKEAY